MDVFFQRMRQSLRLPSARVLDRWVFACLLLLHVTHANGQDQSVPADVSKERIEAFNWFSGLEFPDLKDLPFIRIGTQYPSREKDETAPISYRYGFLLNQKGEEFTTFYLDLRSRTHRTQPSETDGHARISFENADLAQFAAEQLKVVTEPREHDAWHRFGERLSQPAEFFVLSWACSRKGLDDVAATVFDQVRRMSRGTRQEVATLTVKQKLAEDIAHAQMWEAVLKFGDISIPRDVLLRDFERIVRHYPESKHFERAKETAALLEQMIAEDKAHAEQRKRGKPFDELDQQQKVTELIFQLRDQNGQQWSQPGWCHVLWTADGKETSPAHQLVKIGYDAVPQLIEALDNERFSRSVGYHRDFYFSHQVLRISECAQQIITAIADRDLREPRETEPFKTRASTWYAELKKKGEKRYLIDEVEAGGQSASDLASQLVAKYPEVAMPALIAGARHASDARIRATLIHTVGRIPGDDPLPFLLDELQNGSTRSGRLAAAQGLHAHGRREGVTSMIAEWNKSPDEEHDPFGDDIVSFLVTSGRVDAIRALNENLDERSLGVRMHVVEELLRTRRRSGRNGAEAIDALPEGTRNEFEAAVRTLLLNRLDDLEEQSGTSGSRNGKDYTDPRVCDLAGFVLNDLDGERYAFDLGALLEERDRARLLLINVLRQEQGLPERAIPQPRHIAPVSDQVLAPLLEQLETADDQTINAIEAQIVKLGLGVFPSLIKRRDAIASGDLRRIRLNRVANQVAFTVVGVKIGG